MTDEHFLASLRDCSLPPAQFNHLGHLRLAWLQLRRHPFEQAVENTCTLIRNYAAHLGAAGKFHWTVTEALLHLLRAAGAANAPDWPAFVGANPQLATQARACLARHYSAHCLASDAARSGFVAPDLAPLPC
jgi:hypothetical protein